MKEQWTNEIHVPQTIEGAFANGAREMIVVVPDSKTCIGRRDGFIAATAVTSPEANACFSSSRSMRRSYAD